MFGLESYVARFKDMCSRISQGSSLLMVSMKSIFFLMGQHCEHVWFQTLHCSLSGHMLAYFTGFFPPHGQYDFFFFFGSTLRACLGSNHTLLALRTCACVLHSPLSSSWAIWFPLDFDFLVFLADIARIFGLESYIFRLEDKCVSMAVCVSVSAHTLSLSYTHIHTHTYRRAHTHTHTHTHTHAWRTRICWVCAEMSMSSMLFNPYTTCSLISQGSSRHMVNMISIWFLFSVILGQHCVHVWPQIIHCPFRGHVLVYFIGLFPLHCQYDFDSIFLACCVFHMGWLRLVGSLKS